MRFRAGHAAVALLCLGALLLPARAAWALDGGRYGEVRVRQPTGPVRGLVVLLSAMEGWNDGDDAAAGALAAAGAIVVGVDTPTYLRRLDATDEACHRAFTDAESLSRQLQRERGADVYLTPILAGTGAGGTLARVALAQAPANTIAGAAAVRPALSLPGERPLCASPAPEHAAGAFIYAWPGTAPGFIAQADPAHATPMDLVALVEPHLGAAAPRAGDVASLPLIELPAPHPNGQLAIVLSGDGGWRDLDKTIAEKLSADGISVVGWDCLRYFWRAKTPEQTAADLTAVIQTYRARWHATRVVLVGYSFGADVLPFAINRMPADTRDAIVVIALLGFSKSADFEISVTGWLGAPPTDAALPTWPETDRMDPKRILCFYGQEEDDTACPALAARGVEVIRTTGGHHFDGDYDALAARIERRMEHGTGEPG